MRNDAASVDANVQKYHPRNLLRPRAGVALCVTAKLAAKCSYGSNATDRHDRDARPMSASPPIAVKHWHRSETPLRARSGREQVQQKLLLFDPGRHYASVSRSAAFQYYLRGDQS